MPSLKVNQKTLNDGRENFNCQMTMINENLSPSHTFTRTFDIDLHIPTIDKERERKKLVDFKAISSGHTHTHALSHTYARVCWSTDCVVTLKKTDFFKWLDREEEKLRRSFHLNMKEIFEKKVLQLFILDQWIKCVLTEKTEREWTSIRFFEFQSLPSVFKHWSEQFSIHIWIIYRCLLALSLSLVQFWRLFTLWTRQGRARLKFWIRKTITITIKKREKEREWMYVYKCVCVRAQ